MRICLLLVLVFSAARLGAMSVEEAYRAIPHHRTAFDGRSAAMSQTEKAYLQRLFDWIDQAIVARATAMRGVPAAQAYEKVWSMQKTLNSPSNLRRLQKLVEESIHSEYQYLKERQAAEVHVFNAADSNVQTASQRAHQAYSELMALYPAENAHNKQAFYDYLCALDFL